MASLSSKRKVFTNRQLKRSDTRVKVPSKSVSALAIAEPVDQFAAADLPAFDDAIYADAKSRYSSALTDLASIDVRSVMRTVIQQEFNAGGRDSALKMRPYIIKFVGECRDQGMLAARPA